MTVFLLEISQVLRRLRSFLVFILFAFGSQRSFGAVPLPSLQLHLGRDHSPILPNSLGAASTCDPPSFVKLTKVGQKSLASPCAQSNFELDEQWKSQSEWKWEWKCLKRGLSRGGDASMDTAVPSMIHFFSLELEMVFPFIGGSDVKFEEDKVAAGRPVLASPAAARKLDQLSFGELKDFF